MQDFTPREAEVFGLASRGFSVPYISQRLHISTRTVEVHVRRIYEKTGLTGRDQLIEYAERSRDAARI